MCSIALGPVTWTNHTKEDQPFYRPGTLRQFLGKTVLACFHFSNIIRKLNDPILSILSSPNIQNPTSLFGDIPLFLAVSPHVQDFSDLDLANTHHRYSHFHFGVQLKNLIFRNLDHTFQKHIFYANPPRFIYLCSSVY